MQATEGNIALDLTIRKNLTLSLKLQCYKIPIGVVHGPLSLKTVGMFLGINSLISQEFTVHQGIIGEDFNGEIKIMAYVKKNMQFKVGDK